MWLTQKKERHNIVEGWGLNAGLGELQIYSHALISSFLSQSEASEFDKRQEAQKSRQHVFFAEEGTNTT